jgi:hypothetical protein
MKDKAVPTPSFNSNLKCTEHIYEVRIQRMRGLPGFRPLTCISKCRVRVVAPDVKVGRILVRSFVEVDHGFMSVSEPNAVSPTAPGVLLPRL